MSATDSLTPNVQARRNTGLFLEGASHLGKLCGRCLRKNRKRQIVSRKSEMVEDHHSTFFGEIFLNPFTAVLVGHSPNRKSFRPSPIACPQWSPDHVLLTLRFNCILGHFDAPFSFGYRSCFQYDTAHKKTCNLLCT